jgi:hypothetical protein
MVLRRRNIIANKLLCKGGDCRLIGDGFAAIAGMFNAVA